MNDWNSGLTVPIITMNNLSFGQNVNNWGNRSVTLSAKYEL